MKNAFLTHSINFIALNKNGLSDEEREKLAYGLEGIYLTVTKAIIIFLIAIILNFVKEFVITLILFNIIRYPGFGFHATKSTVCLISSTLLILGLPYLFTHVGIPLIVKILLCIISCVCFIIFAPADTVKRPLTNKKKRKIRKICASCLAFIYSFIVIYFDKMMISNLTLAALVIETIFISPIMYIIFKESYNNYKKV